MYSLICDNRLCVTLSTSLFIFHLISFSQHFIVYVSSQFHQSTLHCSCFTLFPSVHTSLFMFHLISCSPHFVDHVSFLFPSVHSPSLSFHLLQSISFIFTLFVCIHILHGHSTIFSVSLFNQICLWKLMTYKYL